MFQDEARFGRITDPRRCWAPAGVRPEVSAQVVREYEYAFAAVSPHDGTLDTLVLPSVNAEAMSVFLAEVSQRHANEFILMVLDGAGWAPSQTLAGSEQYEVNSVTGLESTTESGRAPVGRSAR